MKATYPGVDFWKEAPSLQQLCVGFQLFLVRNRRFVPEVPAPDGAIKVNSGLLGRRKLEPLHYQHINRLVCKV